MNDDLDAIFRLGVGFVWTTSITPSEFIYGLDEFKGEFEEDLEALLGSVFIGITSILSAKYSEVQDVKELEGDYTDSIIGYECMFLGQDFYSDGVSESPNEVSKTSAY